MAAHPMCWPAPVVFLLLKDCDELQKNLQRRIGRRFAKLLLKIYREAATMRNIFRTITALAILSSGVAQAHAGVATTAASCGDVANPAERRTILDSVRGTVAQELGAPLQFKVSTIRVCGNWAFAIATPQRPGGGAISWDRTTTCSGDTSHLVGALSRRDAAGTWRLIDYALCPSDVAWDDWPKKYGVPRDILGF